MTISQYKAMLSGYTGDIRTPSDFEAFWRTLGEVPATLSAETVPFRNTAAIYEKLTLTHPGGTVHARTIRPSGDGKYPLILMFHDLNRGIRGWHHMTRFLALGYAVIALDAQPYRGSWRQTPEEVNFIRRYQEGLILANTARQLPWIDNRRIVTWGEGFGGGLALAAAAMLPEPAGCIALNPFPADIRNVCAGMEEEILSRLDHADAASFAPYLRGPVLMGICLMDEIAPPEGQYAIFNRLTCQKQLKIYPKYGHERVNFFENQMLPFLHP